MAANDLPLLHEWLNREHVARWWHERSTLQEVSDRYLPAIEGSDQTDQYLIVLDGREVGFIQTYLVSDYAEYAALLEVGDGVAGLDLLLADEQSTGRGLGTDVIRAFVRDVVFATPGTTACVADPETANTASVRAFENAGFRRIKEFVDPEEGTTSALMRRERDAQAAP